MLSCTVRDCGLPLSRHDRAWSCAAGHSFDGARSGYINLLQPQDRRSLSAGDSRDAVLARARLIEAGIGRALINAAVRLVRSVRLQPDNPGSLSIVDLGSGTGDALAASTGAVNANAIGIGIDLSTAAADHAARRFPAVTWVVANADRRLPLLDHSVDIMLTLHGRRNPAECARVLSPAGRLIAAVPSGDDLVELRTLVLGNPPERDRTALLTGEHAAHFTVEQRETVRETLTLSRESVVDLLTTTYRGARSSESGKVAALEAMQVTCASELLVLRPL